MILAIIADTHLPRRSRALPQACLAPDGFQIFNPGSPTDRRRQPMHTMGVADVDPRRRIAFTIVAAPGR